MPGSTPISKLGRPFYKIRLKKIAKPINIRIGVSAKENLGSLPYINPGEKDSVFYSCLNEGKELFYEGDNRIEAFGWTENSILCVLIDQDKKMIEWYLKGIHLNSSEMTEPMKAATNLYFFIQLYNNGD